MAVGRILLYTVLGLGTALFVAKKARASTRVDPQPPGPSPAEPAPVGSAPTPPAVTANLPRRGPGGRVLVSDLPPDCQEALVVAMAVGFDPGPETNGWLDCLDRLGLTPQDVYNNVLTPMVPV